MPGETPDVVSSAHQVIEALRGVYGPQAWVLRNDPITELIETILSQNTSDLNSHRAFRSLWERFGSWKDILDAPVDEVADAIHIGGLSRIKAPRIQAVLTEVERRVGGWDLYFLRDLPLDEAKAWLRSLPGVGPKTAACVLLFAVGLPALPVDTHVYRVARRLALIEQGMSPDDAHQALESLVSPDEVYEFHMLLIKHGRQLCKAPRPLCASCPLNNVCPSSLIGRLS
jgi:endonuclease-3